MNEKGTFYYVYVIYNSFTNQPVYVGITKDIQKRFKQHQTDVKLKVKSDYLKENECRIEAVKECRSKEDALWWETVIIEDLRKDNFLLNRQKNLGSKAERTRNAVKSAKDIIKRMKKQK